MRANGVEAARARYREAGTKKDARNRNCAQMGSAYLGGFLYVMKFKGVIKMIKKFVWLQKLALLTIHIARFVQFHNGIENGIKCANPC